MFVDAGRRDRLTLPVDPRRERLSGHVAFHADGHLFSGDLLFAGSVGRVDLPGGDWDTLLDSVRALVARFPGDTIVHPGHGPATTLERELQANPFLRDLRAEST